MFAPGVPLVMSEFNSTSELLSSFVVSVYLLGFAFGPLLMAPLSEIYGRPIVYHVTNVFFVVFNIACAVANSLGSLIGFRFLAGIFGSTSVTIGGGTIADMFRTEERGMAMAIWATGPLLGPTVGMLSSRTRPPVSHYNYLICLLSGPLIGAYLSQAKGWRWDFWFLAILV